MTPTPIRITLSGEDFARIVRGHAAQPVAIYPKTQPVEIVLADLGYGEIIDIFAENLLANTSIKPKTPVGGKV